MSFVGNFSTAQGTSNRQAITFTDTSTGSDPNLTDRTIALYLPNGSLLNGQTYDWPISAGSTITITPLSVDQSLSIVVTWTSSSPIPGSTYTKTILQTYVGFTQDFIYGLIQQIAANSNILNDATFRQNLFIIESEVINANNAQAYGDQFSAQAALSRALVMIQNQTAYF